MCPVRATSAGPTPRLTCHMLLEPHHISPHLPLPTQAGDRERDPCDGPGWHRRRRRPGSGQYHCPGPELAQPGGWPRALPPLTVPGPWSHVPAPMRALHHDDSREGSWITQRVPLGPSACHSPIVTPNERRDPGTIKSSVRLGLVEALAHHLKQLLAVEEDGEEVDLSLWTRLVFLEVNQDGEGRKPKLPGEGGIKSLRERRVGGPGH